MRNDASSCNASLFFSPDAQTFVSQANIDLLSGDSRQFDANIDLVFSLAKVDRRRPGNWSQRIIRFGRFLERGEQATHAVAQTLQLQPLQAGSPQRLDD